VTTPLPRSNPFHGAGTQRLSALADGVFSIVLTLLVFEITPPKDHAPDDLAKMLVGLWPSFLAFGISVGLVGIYWSAHHSMFHLIERTDHALNWLNLLVLAVVSLLPFSTRLIANFHTDPIALAFYGANLVGVGLTLLALWLHAATGRRLVVESMSRGTFWYGVSRCLVGMLGYGLATILAFMNTAAALVVFASVPLLYILPWAQRFWLRLFGL
jgi:uncharacterized membrane protein